MLEIPEAARIAAVLQRYFIHQGMPSADSESVPPAPGKRVLLTLSMVTGYVRSPSALRLSL